jgi:hypothetical protein
LAARVNVSQGRRADLQASRKELPESAANRAFRVTRFASSPPKRRAGTQFAFASPSGIPALRRPSIVRSQKSRRRGSVCGLLSRAIHAFHAAVDLGPTARASASRPGRASAATKWKYAQSLFDLIAILPARSIRSRLALRQPGLAQGASHLLPKGGLEAQEPVDRVGLRDCHRRIYLHQRGDMLLCLVDPSKERQSVSEVQMR